MKIVFEIAKLQFPFITISNGVHGKFEYNFNIEIAILTSRAGALGGSFLTLHASSSGVLGG